MTLTEVGHACFDAAGQGGTDGTYVLGREDGEKASG